MGKTQTVVNQKLFLLERCLTASLNRAKALPDCELEGADQTRVELVAGLARQLDQQVSRIKAARGVE